MKKYKSKKGITLIELIIALGLMGIISAIIFFFFISNQKTLNRVEIKSDLQHDAKVVMEKITKYALEASEVEYGELSNSIKFSSIGTTDKVVFKVRNGATTINGEKVTISGKEVAFGNAGSNDEVICTTLKSMTIWGDKKKNINVSLEFEKKDITYKIEDSFLFRNSKEG